ncbi:MAG: hypothetical protein ACYDBB_16700 [Armatimonadota bacterium]
MLEHFTEDERLLIARCIEIILEGEWVCIADFISLIGVDEQKLRQVIKVIPLLGTSKVDYTTILMTYGLTCTDIRCVIHNCLYNVNDIAHLPRWILRDRYEISPEDVISVTNKWKAQEHTLEHFTEDERLLIERCLEIIFEGEWISACDFASRIGVDKQKLRQVIKVIPLLRTQRVDYTNVIIDYNLTRTDLLIAIHNCLQVVRGMVRYPRWILQDRYGISREEVISVYDKWKAQENRICKNKAVT